MLVIWLLLVMNLFFPWENFVTGGDSAAATGSFGTSHVILMGSYVLIGGLALTRPWGVLKAMFRAWPVLLLMAWIVLSVTWSDDPSGSLDRAARFVALVVFCGYVAHRYSPSEFVQLFTWGFGIAVAASLLVMVVSPATGHSNIGGGYENAWRGGFIHKNWLGAAMSLGLFTSGYSYSIRANRRLVSGLTFLGCLFLLGMSQSATALGSTAATVLLLAVLAAIGSHRTPILRGFALLGTGLVLVVLIVSPIIIANTDLTHLPELIGRSATLTGRTGVWRAVEEAASFRPIAGYGYGFWDHASVTRSNIWLEVDWEAPHAHNTWLEALLQLGIVGLVLTVIIWLVPLCRSLWLIGMRHGNGGLFYFAILFSSLIRSAVETVMFSPALQSLFWLVTIYIYTSRIVRQSASAQDAAETGNASLPSFDYLPGRPQGA